MPIQPSKVTLARDYDGANKSKKKNEWEIVRKRKEYHLVVRPDAFQSSLELDVCCETGSDWSYGPADKVRES